MAADEEAAIRGKVLQYGNQTCSLLRAGLSAIARSLPVVPDKAASLQCPVESPEQYNYIIAFPSSAEVKIIEAILRTADEYNCRQHRDGCLALTWALSFQVGQHA